MRYLLVRGLVSVCLIFGAAIPAIADTPTSLVKSHTALHPGKTGVHVLDTGTEGLMSRAWLVEHAESTIEVQYFIWSTDNIGILAAEALLRAADRGVKVRVIVDDLLIDAPDASLLALAKHPQIDIRIYNPKASVGVTLPKRLTNLVTNFRGLNQRMHDKTFIVDGKVAITGGRNMAAEYFDYHHEYNFRDRDVLLLGEAVKSMGASFERFWESPLSVSVEERYNGLGIMKKHIDADDAQVQAIYGELHAYANAPENFEPQVLATVKAAPEEFKKLMPKVVWTGVDFISDIPGKNDRMFSLSGGGQTTSALAKLVEEAQTQITIQSPYLVMSGEAKALFKRALARGVKVRISTNSLASTDNLPAFSAYRNQRAQLLGMGLEIYEYKPYPLVQQKLMHRFAATQNKDLVFGMHAKSMVVDQKIAYIGTFNLDPRSENLNTEAGAVIHDPGIAKQVEAAIEADMHPDNSWDAAADDPDSHVPLGKRGKVRLWQMAPIKPLL
jgi:putative cardiolipin synthase